MAVNTAQAMSSTLRLFSGMLKSANTDIHVYHLRWTQAYDAAVASGNSELSELQKIYMFTDSLDDANYSAFKDTVHNDDVKGTPLPDTFEAHFNIVCNWKNPNASTTSSGKGDNRKAVFYTAEQTKAYKANKAKQAKSAAEAKKTGKVPAHVGPAVKAGGQRKKPHRPGQSIICYGCNKPGHKIQDCPNVENVDKLDSDEGSDYLGSDDDESNASEVSIPVKDKKGKKSAKSVRWKSNHCRMIAWVSNTPTKYLMALDNCAYSSVLCNEKFVSDIVPGKCAPLLNFEW